MEKFKILENKINYFRSQNLNIKYIMEIVANDLFIYNLSVDERVEISTYILQILTYAERKELSRLLLEEQVNEQRKKLNLWSTITAQAPQIDTGYVAQHLVSLQTQIPGQGMRGKGDDLSNGAEVKSANFLDSLDKKGATAPRWNFTAVTREIMERFLTYPSIYLLSMDQNPNGYFRTRIWCVDVSKHSQLKERYKEWMEVKGYPKFNSSLEAAVNFQLFPPRNKTLESFARHGNNKTSGFPSIQIQLENYDGSSLIFHAEQNEKGEIVIIKF